MATIKVKLRPSSVEGRPGVIFYQVTHNRKSRHITTRLRINPSLWDADEGKLALGVPDRSIIQSRIDSDLLLLRRIISELDNRGADYKVEDIINRYKSPQLGYSGQKSQCTYLCHQSGNGAHLGADHADLSCNVGKFGDR